MMVTTGGRGSSERVVLVVVIVVEQLLELELGLHAGLDEDHGGAELLGDQFDHLVGSDWVAVTISPAIISMLTMSAGVRLSLGASSWMVTPGDDDLALGDRGVAAV